jgi:hypothetical protein
MSNDVQWPPPGWEIAPTDKSCTGCGHCCQQLPCNLAGGHNPCIALQHHDGRYWCGLVELDLEGVREHLLVGRGCGATIIPTKLRKRCQTETKT